jgi:hypothetical protein
MHTDRAAAPYQANPYYAAAAAAQRSAQPTQPRDATPNEEGEDRDAEPACDAEPSCAADCSCDACASTSQTERRLRYLEHCITQQTAALQTCVQELKTMRTLQAKLEANPRFIPEAPARRAAHYGAATLHESPRQPPYVQSYRGPSYPSNVSSAHHYSTPAPFVAPPSQGLRRLPAVAR